MTNFTNMKPSHQAEALKDLEQVNVKELLELLISTGIKRPSIDTLVVLAESVLIPAEDIS